MRLVCNKTDVGVRQPHFSEQQSPEKVSRALIYKKLCFDCEHPELLIFYLDFKGQRR